MAVHRAALDAPGRERGTDPSHVPMYRFVVCLQNHDQMGTAPMGDRLHNGIPAETWRAATAVLLTVPMTPLLFMGQEWSASTPFQYFTDFEPELGHQVTDGRRREFASFPEFSHPEARLRIPDPQSPATFAASRLNWAELNQPAHAAMLALYRALLALRLKHEALGASCAPAGDAEAPDSGSLVIRREGQGEEFWIAARLVGQGRSTWRHSPPPVRTTMPTGQSC